MAGQMDSYCTDGYGEICGNPIRILPISFV